MTSFTKPPGVATGPLRQGTGVLSLAEFGVPSSTTADVASYITNAFQTAVAAGKALYAPAGTYAIGTVSIPAGLELYGDGERTIFKVLGTAQYPFVNAVTTGWTNVYLHDFAVDGNKANIAGDPDVNGNPECVMMLSSADATPASNIIVERLHVHDSKRLGIIMQNVQGGAIRDCVVEDNDRDGITLYSNCKQIEITGNRVSRCNDDYIGINSELGTSTGHLCEKILVARNMLVGPGARNKGKGVCVRGGRMLNITDNIIESVCESGVHIRDFNTTTAEAINVTANVIRNTGQGGSAGKDGVVLQAGAVADHVSGYAAIRNINIAGNLIDSPLASGITIRSDHNTLGEMEDVRIGENIVIAAAQQGIAISTGSIRRIFVTGNTVRNSAQQGIASSHASNTAIFVEGNVVLNCQSLYGIQLENIVNGSCVANVAADTQAVPTQTHGLRLRTNSGEWRVAQNHAFGNTTLNIDHTGSTWTQREGFYLTVPIAKPTVTGSRAGNAALASLLTALSNLGVLVDSSTA